MGELLLVAALVVAALLAWRYTRPTLRLQEVTVAVPGFGGASFAVTKGNKPVAWKLFIQSSTRVSLRPLDAGAGSIREAMSSLYSLFSTTRQVLADAEPSAVEGKPTVEHLAIAMLNHELRPFLTEWHPRLKRWEGKHPSVLESSWPDNEECRAELAAMQERIRPYVIGFGELAGVPDPVAIMDAPLGQSEGAGHG